MFLKKLVMRSMRLSKLAAVALVEDKDHAFVFQVRHA
jgi:hypothetical protein